LSDQKTSRHLPATAGYGYGDTTEETCEGPGVWLHVPHRGALKAVLMQVAPFRYVSHWVRSTYQLCPGSGKCSWCDLGLGTKTRYVYALYDTDRKRQGLLEVGPDTAGQMKDLTRANGDEPGLLFRFTKAGGVINGAIKVELLHDWYRISELPPGVDIERVLRGQWDAAAEALPAR